MSKLPISVCTISGGDAHRIGRMLAAVSGWVTEIIVVINEGVTDGTAEIAREHGAHVHFEPWKGFAGQFESCTAKATQPWILYLAVDEVVTPALRDEIHRTLADSRKTQRYVAFDMPRCLLMLGRWLRHGDWYPDRGRRLYKRGHGVWRSADPHECLEVDGPVGHLKSDILHYSNESMDRHIAKISLYSDYFAKDCLRRNRKVNVFDWVVRPLWRIIRGYFFRLGFLDGWQGYYIAWHSAFYTIARYAKAHHLQVSPPGTPDPEPPPQDR